MAIAAKIPLVVPQDLPISEMFLRYAGMTLVHVATARNLKSAAVAVRKLPWFLTY